ncbi:hypothetical protein NKI96_05800 [Mesorhizobium sp. M0292]|uniref:hypothetical protein n=1 Tax=Mesorhizobium sp. M0292 TaxID=2956929 RepID=UPI00333AB610
MANEFGWSGWLLQLVDWTDGCIGVTDCDMDEIWTIAGWNADRNRAVKHDYP